MNDQELKEILAALLLAVQRDVNGADEYVDFAIKEIKQDRELYGIEHELNRLSELLANCTVTSGGKRVSYVPGFRIKDWIRALQTKKDNLIKGVER